MKGVELIGVTRRFPGGVEALVDVDLAVEPGELFVIVGPSGSGKSTLLRMIAGLDTPDSGSIAIGGSRVDGRPPRLRDVAMAFQSPAVYPYLNVRDNLAFGLRARSTPRREVEARVAETASLLGLEGLLDRRPATLSGGQRQRTALGRAIALRPAVFLLDEPFSALDAPLRASTRSELADLHRRIGTTTIVVTHDQAEAMALADRLAVLDRGRLVQVGRPEDVYDRPASRFVAGFMGSPPMNLLPCRVRVEAGIAQVELEAAGADATGATIPAPPVLLGRHETSLELGLRPEQVEPDVGDPETRGRLVVRGRVARVEPLGPETIVAVDSGAVRLTMRRPGRAGFAVGQSIALNLAPTQGVWFDRTTGARLADEARGSGQGRDF